MKKNRFRIIAKGRISGSLGITYTFEEFVICENEDEIWESLYTGKTESKTKWESISNLKIFTEKNI